MHKAAPSFQLFLRTFREKLLAGFAWNLLSAATLQGSVLLSTIVLARLLALESFGMYSVLVTTVMTMAAIAQGGTGIVATKYVAEFAADPMRVSRILRMCSLITMGTGLVAALLLFFGAPWLAAGVLGNASLEPYVRIVAIAVLFQVSVAYQHGALQGFGAFRQVSFAGMAAGFGHLLFTAAGAWWGQLEGAVLGFVAASLSRALCFHVALASVRNQRRIPRSERIGREDYRLIWKFALPASLAGFITLPCLWLVTVLVTRLPNGLSMVALFSVAHQIRLAVLQLPSLLNVVAFVMLSRMNGLSERAGFRKVFWTNIVVSLCFVVPTVGVLMVAATQALGLYGAEFTGGELLLIVLLASVIPEVLGMNAYQLVQSAGRMWRSLLLLVLPRDLLYLGLAAFLIAQHGVIGAAIAYLVAQVVGLILTERIGRNAAHGQSAVVPVAHRAEPVPEVESTEDPR